MGLFDRYDHDFALSWRETSLDGRLGILGGFVLFGFFIATLSKLITGLTLQDEAKAFAALILAAAAVSLVHRWWRGWRWSGLSLQRIVRALATFGVFAVSFIVLKIPLTANSAPFYALFIWPLLGQVFWALGVVQLSNAEFDARCGGRSPAEYGDLPRDPAWRRVLRAVEYVAGTVGFLLTASYLYVHVRIHDFAQSTLDRAHPIPYPGDGATLYLTPNQSRLISALDHVAIPAVFAAVIGGLLLHFVVDGLFVPHSPAGRMLRRRAPAKP